MTEPSLHECDVLIVGSGAGGLSAAITARLAGLDVLVIEKEAKLGGSTARSGGNMWIPCNPIAMAEGVEDSLERAVLYIQSEAGNFFDATRARAYLENGPKMIATFAQKTSALRFVRTEAVGDNHPHLPGAAESGRTLTTPPYDGRALGRHLKHLAPPLPELTFLGMQIQPGRDLNHFFHAFTSLKSLAFVLRRLAAHAADLLRSGRTTRLANGNGLAARLVKSTLDLGAEIWRNTPALEIIKTDGKVSGAIVLHDGKRVRVHARRGLVLACGGFPHDEVRRRTLSPIGALGAGRYSLAPAGNVGEGLRLAETAGGKVEDRLPNTVSWTPVSRVPQANGEFHLFPHGFDRNKPGMIAVTRHGERFVNEAVVGNDFIRAMVRACGGDPVEGFLIADHATIRRYGIGVVRPFPAPLSQHIRSGYLVRGRTLAELAQKAGIRIAPLEQTIAAFNHDAALGKDNQFHRGETAIERRNGDPRAGLNPCLAPVAVAPFYCVKLLPGDFSTLAGLRTDEHARVLGDDGLPVAGLYAAGNDSLSMFGGNSPSGGATLGPALTFGFIAASHLAGIAPSVNSETTACTIS